MEGTMPLRILLVHRHSLLLHALKALVEGHGLQVTGQSNRDGAGRMAESLGPDVAIVDFDLPSANGLDTAREILRLSPLTKVIILTSQVQEFYITEALQIGVSGYVLTTRTADELLRCIEEVAQGRSYFSPEVANVILQPFFGNKHGRGQFHQGSGRPLGDQRQDSRLPSHPDYGQAQCASDCESGALRDPRRIGTGLSRSLDGNQQIPMYRIVC
jgi:DNA-binding NarL/FixJ family response regulator